MPVIMTSFLHSRSTFRQRKPPRLYRQKAGNVLGTIRIRCKKGGNAQAGADCAGAGRGEFESGSLREIKQSWIIGRGTKTPRR